jgi:hypothetical protein
MKYLCFIRHAETYRDSGPPAELMQAMGQFVQTSMRDGTLVDTGGLLPSKEGARVRLANGKISVTDGPFIDSKEIIGGWAILNAESKAQALEIATEFMDLHRQHWPAFEGESELRPMFEPRMGPDTQRIKRRSSNESHGIRTRGPQFRSRCHADPGAAIDNDEIQRGAGKGRCHA